ncbi:mechanosensitive ion channel domain-containing protein [Halalkalirubrum salinum]|uniref:mechanosensitive ion channel domain-containing protein n=1 Tax=Halalkalirubrum salinum TaxID=2563889 RepID=UPI0010FB2C17|nr:mechanosensitive ion channel domain-containing protein [Halalkalirubrum salinum]
MWRSSVPLVPVIDSVVNRFITAIPSFVTAIVFAVIAYIGIRIIRRLVRSVITGAFPAEQRLIADFAVVVVTIFLWFAAGLVLLDILGLGQIAASLGTAVGFVALGVSYALSEMIEDTVAGIYLLKDPDFNVGDSVTTGSVDGTVAEIGLRKSRFTLENGDTTVLANRDVEAKWTKRATERSE